MHSTRFIIFCMILDLTGFYVFLDPYAEETLYFYCFVYIEFRIFVLALVPYIFHFFLQPKHLNISFVRRLCPMSIYFCVNKTKCSNCNLITAWARRVWTGDDVTIQQNVVETIAIFCVKIRKVLQKLAIKNFYLNLLYPFVHEKNFFV